MLHSTAVRAQIVVGRAQCQVEKIPRVANLILCAFFRAVMARGISGTELGSDEQCLFPLVEITPGGPLARGIVSCLTRRHKALTGPAENRPASATSTFAVECGPPRGGSREMGHSSKEQEGRGEEEAELFSLQPAPPPPGGMWELLSQTARRKCCDISIS